MDEKIVHQILDELFSSFENSETQSAALLLFLKDQGIATAEKLAPYFEQAGKTSEVRWRAARVRMGALLASAMKAPEPVAEKKITPTEERIQPTADVDSKGTGKQIPGQKSAGPKKRNKRNKRNGNLQSRESCDGTCPEESGETWR